jgi:hypothetical protein
MRFEAIHPGPPLTPDALDAYAQQHSIELPGSLRRQLLEQNGGAPWQEFCVRLPGGTFEVVASFFGVGMADQSLELAWMVATFAGRVPDGMLPFADDPGGNLYLLHEDGSVWFWDHEQEGHPEALMPVADSFDGFIAALLPCPE